jgi:hypothetical protein
LRWVRSFGAGTERVVVVGGSDSESESLTGSRQLSGKTGVGGHSIKRVATLVSQSLAQLIAYSRVVGRKKA